MIRNTRSGTSLLFSGKLRKRINVRKNHQRFIADVNLFEEGGIGTVRSIYERWLNDPNNVGPAWDSFFKSLVQPESTSSKSEYSSVTVLDKYEPMGKRKYHDKLEFDQENVEDEVKHLEEVLLVHRLIRSYQVRGHHLAKLNSLDFQQDQGLPLFRRGKEALYRHYAEEHLNLLRKVKYELDLDKVYPLPGPTTHIGGDEEILKLSEIISRLEKVYCGRIGLEYMHINSYNQCDFLRKQFEVPRAFDISRDQKRLLLARLARTVGFQEFFDKHYPHTIKYNLNGCEVLIPCIKTIVDHSTDFGVDHFIFGMPHRGKMNVLSNVFRVPLVQIMSLFNQLERDNPKNSDFMYQLGMDKVKLNRVSNKKTRLTLLATPSHVESVNSVVLGRTKIEQMMRTQCNTVMPILVHGDLSFSGQGISYEILNLSDLSAFNTRGTIHIVLNNQAGSISDSQIARSEGYSTDVGKIINAPIFHVNAADPEAVQNVSVMAANWRNIFRMDCIIELVSYTKHGNDLTTFNKIKEIPNVYEKYVDQLQYDNVITSDEVNEYKDRYMGLLNAAHKEVSKETQFRLSAWMDAPKLAALNKPGKIPPTGISESEIVFIGKIHSSPPPGDFVVHKAVTNVLERRAMLLSQKLVNWSLAEAIAFGSLLKEGVHVRLSGVDVERSIWANSHYVIHHQMQEGASYTPMEYIHPAQARFSIHNTPLSQLSVLGFEIGYSQCDPNILVVWEANEGDCANVAQVMMDEYLACGECKWGKPSGIVVNLPHGRNVIAPDHANCRPERYLQMCNDDADTTDLDSERQLYRCNWIVTYPTTPANCYHVLRRQILMPFRKPLINILPKTLIATESHVSHFTDMLPKTSFKRIITEDADPAKVKTVVFCCGKVYYQLAALRKIQNKEDRVTLIRIEQISPFPYDLLRLEITKYLNAKFVFAQEEPKNMGFHHHCVPRLQNILGNRPLRIVTAPPSAHANCGYPSEHDHHMTQIERASIDD